VKFWKMLSLVSLLLLAASIVRADDTRLQNGGGPGGSPPCGSNEFSSNAEGVINFDCLVTSTEAGGTGMLFSFTDEAPDSADGGVLNCSGPLVTIDGWTETQTVSPGGTDTCTLTAPTYVTKQVYDNIDIATGCNLRLPTCDPYVGGPTLSTFINDGDCDLDDFVLGIPVGCDLIIDNFNVFNNPSSGTSPFAADTNLGVGANGTPLPPLTEPGTLSLLLLGLGSLPFVRRKLAR
jgi:hypothetical protein